MIWMSPLTFPLVPKRASKRESQAASMEADEDTSGATHIYKAMICQCGKEISCDLASSLARLKIGLHYYTQLIKKI